MMLQQKSGLTSKSYTTNTFEGGIVSGKQARRNDLVINPLHQMLAGILKMSVNKTKQDTQNKTSNRFRTAMYSLAGKEIGLRTEDPLAHKYLVDLINSCPINQNAAIDKTIAYFPALITGQECEVHKSMITPYNKFTSLKNSTQCNAIHSNLYDKSFYTKTHNQSSNLSSLSGKVTIDFMSPGQ
jgi:hypothetical protein